MPLSNRQKNQAIYIKELLLTASWRAYEEFIKDFVFDYLNSSLTKDTLGGVKMAIEEAKKLVQIYETEKQS